MDMELAILLPMMWNILEKTIDTRMLTDDFIALII